MSYPAESFERYIVPALFEPWAESLVEAAEPQPGERTLDVACGTGIVARQVAHLVGPGGTVAGLDSNPEMIRVARTAAEGEGLSIDFREGRAEVLPFPDAAFDLVTCQFGLMLFARRMTSLREMRRVLRPGGRVVLSVWQSIERHPFYMLLHEASVRRLGMSGVQPAYSLPDDEQLRWLVTDAGFREVEVEAVSLTARFPEPEEFLNWELTVDQQSIAGMRDLSAEAWQAVMQSIRDDLREPVDAAMQDGELVLDFHAHLARGIKASRAERG